MERLAAQDPDVERHFVAYFGPLLSAKLRGRVRSADAVEDLRQDTLLRVLATIRRDGAINDPHRLGPYVYGVCNNVLREHYRDKAKHPTADENAPEQYDIRPNPESQFVTAERRAIVHDLINELPEKDRYLLSCVFIEDRDKDDVCKEMGVDADYMRVLLHRARAKFKKILEEKVGKRAFSNHV